MNPEAAQTYVEALLDYQYDLLFARTPPWGVNHAEFIFVQTARIIKAHENIRQSILAQIEQTLFCLSLAEPNGETRPRRFVPDDFIWFLAHLTRWAEFKEIAKRLEGTPADKWKSNPAKCSSQMLKDALTNEWEDREFYESFSGTSGWV